MKFIKKTLSIALVLLMLLSICAVSLSVSAAETEVSPAGYFEDYYESPDDLYDDDVNYYTIYGDCDQDSVLTIKDATLIQKSLAGLVEFDEYVQYLADTDGDQSVTIKDATAIQKAIAGITNGVPMHTVYEYSEGMEVSAIGYGCAEVNMLGLEEGYYDISVFVADESEMWAEIVLIDSNGVCVAQGEYISANLEAGDYKLIVSNWSEIEYIAQIYATWYAEFPLFNPDDAVVLTEELQSITASAEGHVFKVEVPQGDSSVVVYTDGEAPMLNAVVFDSNLTMVSDVSILEDYDTGNVFVQIYADEYETDYYYVFLYQVGEGTDYEVCVTTYAELIESLAVEIKLNEEYAVSEEYYEEDYGDYVESYYLLTDILKFTPDEDDYYKVSGTCDNQMSVAYIISSDPEFTDFVYFNYYYESFFDVEYLEAGVTYYIVVEGFLFGDGDLNVLITNSNEAEYDEAHANDFIEDDNTGDDYYQEIPEDCDTISAGETVDISITEPYDTVYLKLVADKDGELVIYSDGSSDAYINIYDGIGEWIGYSDDILALDSYDFAVIGDVEAGETYYIAVASWNEADEFTVTVVNAEDYVPLV